MRIRAWLAGALATAIAVVSAPAVPALAAPKALPKSTTSCAGVWVIVDRGNGQVATRCATKYRTGVQALTSAGFTVKQDDGFVLQIHGFPAKPDAKSFTKYWSYWHVTRNADGTWGEWKYSDKGATTSRPAKDVAEGWRFGGSGKTAPAKEPPRAYLSSPTPTVVGTAKVGNLLTVDTGRFTPTPDRITYRWYRSGKAIKGATKATYKIAKADRGKRLKVVVTARGSGLQTVTKSSAQTAKVKN